MRDHDRWMKAAIEQAAKAASLNEVPIGAVIVRDGEIISSGHNLRESESDPTAHAEIIALKAAGKKLGTWRLDGATMYVTCEPCPMCAGAIILSRMKALIFGCRDPKAGAVGSVYNIIGDNKLNHSVEIIEGVLAEECSRLLSEFFKRMR